MEIKLVAVGTLLIIAGIIRHFIPTGVLPKVSVGLRLNIPGWVIAVLGVILLIAGILYG